MKRAGRLALKLCNLFFNQFSLHYAGRELDYWSTDDGDPRVGEVRKSWDGVTFFKEIESAHNQSHGMIYVLFNSSFKCSFGSYLAIWWLRDRIFTGESQNQLGFYFYKIVDSTFINTVWSGYNCSNSFKAFFKLTSVLHSKLI